MARVELAPEVLKDFDRILNYLAETGCPDAGARVMDIVKAFDLLVHSPLIGRPVANGKRELVIGRKSRAYLALYRYEEQLDTVFILAVRSQREAGFR